MKKLLGIILSLAMVLLYIVPLKATTSIIAVDVEFEDILEDEEGYLWKEGEPIIPSIIVKYKGQDLVEGTDYEVSYKDNTDLGIGYVVLTGIGAYSDVKECKFRIKKYLYETLVLEKAKFVYDNEVHKPLVKGTKSEPHLPTYWFKRTYYSYDKANEEFKNVGRYFVEAEFIDDCIYFGRCYGEYMIVPKGTSIKSLRAGRKKFTVKWKKQRTQTTGYEIKYSLKKNTTTKKTIKKLKRRKTYYVRVRTYKLDNKGKKICSSWSKRKHVRVR